MPRRWFVWCAVAVAAAAAGLGLVVAWHELWPDPSLQPGAGRDATASPAASLGADDAASGDAALRREAAEAAGDLDRQPATAARLAPTRVMLAVLAMPRGVPAAGAHVFFAEPRDDARRRADAQLRRELGDTGAALRRTGRRLVADERGRAEFDADAESIVVAELDGAYGEIELRPYGRDADGVQRERLELWPDVALRVEVRDPEGRACPHVAVEARAMTTSHTRGSEEHHFDVGVTDANGSVRLTHVQTFVRLPGPLVIDWSMTLGCEGTHFKAVQREVRPDELLRGEPIVVTVPVGGTVELEVVGRDGKPAYSRAFLLDDANNITCTPLSSSVKPLAVFAQVPLGRTWRAFDPWQFEEQVVGPTRPGETVRARVVAHPRHWRVVGTVRRSDGASLGWTQVEIDFTTRSGAAVTRSSTATDGKWSVLAHDAREIGARAVELRVVGPHTAPWKLALNRELTPGALDLGEIVVPPPAGEVMLASIEVMLDGRNVTDEVGASLWPAEGRRQPHPTVTARSPGRVELRGWPLQGDGEIQCWHPLTSPARAALRSGHHHIIELRRGVSLELSIEPPPVPPAHFRARLVPGDGSLPQYTGADDGRMFRWRNQAPGAHRLQVLAFETVVYDQPIVLRAGANVWPPAGERIDLSRTAAAARVAARGPDGERIDCETLVIPADASELPSDWEHRVDSTEWIPLRGAAVDVLVRADGWVPARVRNVSTDTVVTMQRLTTVVFEPPLGGPAVTVIAVVRDGLDDALLRSFQTWTWTTPFDLGERTEPAEYTFAPGAELDVHLVRGGVADVPRRIVVEAGGPQRVELR